MHEMDTNVERPNPHLRLYKLVFGSVSLFPVENEQMLRRHLRNVYSFPRYLINGTIATVSISKVFINPQLFLLCSVPSVMSGDTCGLITGIYCYISDVAKAKPRALRMVLNEASLRACMMIGNILTGYVYEATNVITMLTISSTLLFLALSFVLRLWWKV
uniref:Uncharacterized protein n=1 Tax=Glossina palpalis gambiensis TaxID=67801 RepID=A0A1B0C6F9_9MUSC